ncbi:tectonic isoform X1 [Zeugodacus cucurbitae]|uniref:Tectonic n=1 Tax=Zeugodacus cucurbitae TaxID=28588 RepID=A0A0A1WXP6_ZEUCU|nr:tectonic isoform X1 [Zeugodacus cucurbitae]
MKLILLPAQFLLLLQVTSAVKIGISRINLDITSTTTTTTTTEMPLSATEPTTVIDLLESTATTDITEPETESTTPTTTTTTFKSTKTTTIKPNFTISLFPPRLRTTKSPKITTTTIVTTSTIQPTVASTIATNTVEDTPKASNVKAHSSPGVYYCKCDLLLDACDINCCCDRDCSPEALNIFDCNDAPMQKQFRSRLEEFQYQHGLPSCKVNDGWLCVFRSNTRKERQKSPEIDLNTNHYYKWPTLIWDTVAEQHSEGNLNAYRYGDPLQFLNMKTMTLKQFDLPNTFQPPHCQIMESVKFLKPYKANCLAVTLEELQLSARNIINFIQNNKLLLKPISEANEPGYITNILSNFKLKICDVEKCDIMPLNNSTAVEQRLQFFYPAEIKFKLLHNYTQLLGGLVELNVTNGTQKGRELWQTYHLEYIYKNLTVKNLNKELNETAFEKTAVKLTSGALGYTQGKPIIIARFIANNESAALSQSNQVLDYFHVNATKATANHTFSLFTTHQSLCRHVAAPENLINYGINVLKQCKLRFGNESLTKIPQKERNFTEMCLQLQTQINAQLFVAVDFEFDEKFPDLYISQLGRPANRSDKWTPLKVENQNFAPISGEFNAQTQSFSCRNMLLNIAYEFLVGQFTEAGVAQQALVKHATLLFGERNDLEFELDEVIEVPLTVSVMFFDYSKDVYNSGVLRTEVGILWIIILMNFIILYTNN